MRESYNDLEEQRAAALSKITELEALDGARPKRPESDDIALLDALPYLRFNLAQAPEELLARLFEVVQLNVMLNIESDEATITITLPAEMLSAVADAAEGSKRLCPPRPGCLRAKQPKRAGFVRAPNGIRTRATALKGRRPGPLDDEG